MSTQETIHGWHWLCEDGAWGWGAHKKPVVGKTYTTKQKIRLCGWGFHGSRRAIDALNYAPGPVIEWCRYDGEIVLGDDKFVASRRTTLALADATGVLNEWSCWCAEQVLPIYEKHQPGDDRPRKAIKAKRKWLKGEIRNEELAAARAAAWDAAWDEQNAELERLLRELLGLPVEVTS